MNLIVCVDDAGGMAFNGRRQSRDRNVIADIVKTVDKAPLYVTKATANLLAGTELALHIGENPMPEAGEDSYCWLETKAPQDMQRVRSVTVYRWNRAYPADVKLELDWEQWRLASREEWQGYSHEVITKEVWVR